MTAFAACGFGVKGRLVRVDVWRKRGDMEAWLREHVSKETTPGVRGCTFEDAGEWPVRMAFALDCVTAATVVHECVHAGQFSGIEGMEPQAVFIEELSSVVGAWLVDEGDVVLTLGE